MKGHVTLTCAYGIIYYIGLVQRHSANCEKHSKITIHPRTPHSTECKGSYRRVHNNITAFSIKNRSLRPCSWGTCSSMPSIWFSSPSGYARAVLEIVIVSVCPSVCHTRALWRNERIYYRYFDTTRKCIYSIFLIPTEVDGR